MSAATVGTVQARAYTVPTDTPEADGTLAWSSTTLVLVQASAAGHTGTGWTYADASLVPLVHGLLAPVVEGCDALDVTGAWAAMRRAVRNQGRPGLASSALSAVESALQDLKARVLGVSLVHLLGRAHEEVMVYGSGGFTTYDDAHTRAQVSRWADELSIPRVKIKIGESFGSAVGRDLHRAELVRETVGPDVEVFVDANGAYTVGQAVRVGRALDDLDVRWFEEPVSSDDRTGLRRVREALDCDVAAGEYGYDLPYFAAMVAADAVDCLQVDVTRCGGFGEWLRAAAVAAARNIQVSAHCAPNLAVHVASATENMRHIEYFHDHVRIEEQFFDGVLAPRGGVLRPDPDAPGHGLTLREADVAPWRVA